MEKDLLRNPICQAMAGISSVYYADITTISATKPKSDGMEVVFNNGKTWHVIEHDGASFGSAGEAGRAYTQTVDILYHGNQTESVRALDEMTQCRFVVKCVDNNGVEWLVGSKEVPLRFTYESNNDGEADGETAYQLHFKATGPWPEMRLY